MAADTPVTKPGDKDTTKDNPALIETGADGVPEQSEQEKKDQAEKVLETTEAKVTGRERAAERRSERANAIAEARADGDLTKGELDALDEADGEEDPLAGLSVAERTQINTLPSAGTVEDPAGVERLVVTNIDQGWRPAQVEPDPVEVARLERVTAALEAKKQERLTALSTV